MSFLRIMMPYCLMQIDGDCLIVLNRKYKPLGVASSDFVDYETHPSKVRIKGLNPAKAAAIGMRFMEARGSFYLYEDSTFPDTPQHLARYNAILAQLMSLEVETL